MGLLSSILTAPVSLPVSGVTSVFKKIHEAVEQEMYNPEAIRAELMALGDMLDRGEIDEDAFEEAEERLLDRLDEVEEYLAAKNG
ncbi:MAG: gas vesicle protein GvpG [Pseudomonadota bacterium]